MTAKTTEYTDFAKRAFAPATRLNEMFVGNVERVAKFQYELAGDLMQFGARADARDGQGERPDRRSFRKQREIATKFAEKAPARQQALAKLAADSQAGFANVVRGTRPRSRPARRPEPHVRLERRPAYPAAVPSAFCDAFRAAQQAQVHSPAMSQERLIKKYANRRLYDASQSRHITLDDIRGLIVKGEKIRVVEDKTGHDITRHILLQVIAEQEQFGRPILSTTVLESIIRFYGNSMQGFLASFLEKSIETFLHQQDNLQAQISKIVSQRRSRPWPTSRAQNLEALSKMQESMLSALHAEAREVARDEDEKRP